jgi:hypothetical protein
MLTPFRVLCPVGSAIMAIPTIAAGDFFFGLCLVEGGSHFAA